MARQELLPHQEGCAASVERALKYVPGLRSRIEPAFRAEMKRLGIPDHYDQMTRRDAAVTLYVLEEGAREALGARFAFYPNLKTSHQQLWQGERNLFYDAAGYGCLSPLARCYMGGLLAHGAAVMAFSNPSTNSYRGLVPGFEAPISAIYSLGNRSAAIRIPRYANRPVSARFEFRPHDASCNPYLAMAAQLLAGLDCIRRQLDPTELGFGPFDEDVFAWPAQRRARIQALPTSLEQGLDALERDHAFLLEGGSFSEDLVRRWLEKKRAEEREVRNRPHPYEIELYHDL